jgi:hypothetical protein
VLSLKPFRYPVMRQRCRRCLLFLVQNRLLEDLCQMRPQDDCSDILKQGLVKPLMYFRKTSSIVMYPLNEVILTKEDHQAASFLYILIY